MRIHSIYSFKSAVSKVLFSMQKHFKENNKYKMLTKLTATFQHIQKKSYNNQRKTVYSHVKWSTVEV